MEGHTQTTEGETQANEGKGEESLKRKREEEGGQDNAKRLRPDEQTTGSAAVATPHYTKKKKEYVPKSTFVADDEFEDILVSGWFYLDANNQQQGPFTTRDMKEW
jgi:hypothetical protein